MQRAGGGAERAFAPTFHEIQIVIRDLVSDIRGGFFSITWRIDIRNKEQLSKLLLRLLTLDSFPAISEDFKQEPTRPTQKPTVRKRGRISYNFKFDIRLFSSY